jgi:hypothetical protein
MAPFTPSERGVSRPLSPYHIFPLRLLLYPEDGGSRLLRNVGKCLLDCMESYLVSFIKALEPFFGSWPLFSVLQPFYTDCRIPFREWAAHHKAAAHTQDNRHRINTHTNIHALGEIRTHDPSFRASEDSSCIRRRGHRDQLSYFVRQW